MSIAYDEAARLPLIMHYPRVLPAGLIWRSGVSSVDLMPTIMHAAGLFGRLDEDYTDRSLIPDLLSADETNGSGRSSSRTFRKEASTGSCTRSEPCAPSAGS